MPGELSHRAFCFLETPTRAENRAVGNREKDGQPRERSGLAHRRPRVSRTSPQSPALWLATCWALWFRRFDRMLGKTCFPQFPEFKFNLESAEDLPCRAQLLPSCQRARVTTRALTSRAAVCRQLAVFPPRQPMARSTPWSFFPAAR